MDPSAGASPPPRSLRLAFVGFGAVNKALLRIAAAKRDALADTCGVAIAVVGVCDSKGGRVAPAGAELPQAALIDHKAKGVSVADFAEGEPCVGAVEMLEALGADGYDIVVDGSPYASDGGVGLAAVRAALAAGKHAVLANKAPLVTAFDELAALAGRPPEGTPGCRALPPRMRFSATVCGGLPVVNVGARDLGGACATFSAVEGVFNSTTNYILAEVQAGRTFEDALAEAQRLGIAEADPSLDIDGHDTASKLVIIANAVLGVPARKADVAVEGVRGVTPAMVAEADAAGEVYKLVASAKRVQGGGGDDDQGYGGFELSVRPKRVAASSFLGGVCGWEMAIVLRSDIFEEVSLKIDEPTVDPTSAAVLRDVLHLAPAALAAAP